MKLEIIHHGEVRDCKLMIKNVDKWRGELLRLNGKKVRVRMDEDVGTRSPGQNRLYWYYLALIEDETGNTSDDLHEYFKNKFLPKRFVRMFNEDVQLSATTTKIDPLVFTEYLDKICAVTGVPIPKLEV